VTTRHRPGASGYPGGAALLHCAFQCAIPIVNHAERILPAWFHIGGSKSGSHLCGFHIWGFHVWVPHLGVPHRGTVGALSWSASEPGKRRHAPAVKPPQANPRGGADNVPVHRMSPCHGRVACVGWATRMRDDHRGLPEATDAGTMPVAPASAVFQVLLRSAYRARQPGMDIVWDKSRDRPARAEPRMARLASKRRSGLSGPPRDF